MAAKMHFVFVKKTKHALGAATAAQAGGESPPAAELVGNGMIVRDPQSGVRLFSIKPEHLAVATVEPIADGLLRPHAFDVPDDKSPQLRATSTTLVLSAAANMLTITPSTAVPSGRGMLVQVFDPTNNELQPYVGDTPDPGTTGGAIKIPFDLVTGRTYHVLALIQGAEPKNQSLTV